MASLWPNARLDNILAAANRAHKTSHISPGVHTIKTGLRGLAKSQIEILTEEDPTGVRFVIQIAFYGAFAFCSSRCSSVSFGFSTFYECYKNLRDGYTKAISLFLMFQFLYCLLGIYLIVLAFNACHFWS